ncbi:hypothetical protein HPP92_028524 [Vanilla planifolia]|uniref:Uncharacterized protein n=1 Tax=Vanilla planifolia TaxID=51239 RepID=A0A835P8V9_VANPL|nr:hypothetical protein HPP92_028524 [Vanilla planifolia]
MPSVSDVGSGKAIGVDMLQTLRKNVDALNISETFSKGKKRLLAPEVAVDVGWDKLPGVDDSGATFLQNHGYTSSLPSASREFAKGASMSSVRRNASSRLESKFSEESRRKEISYARQRRKHEHIDLDAEGINDERKYLGRCQLPFRLHGRGRGDCWVDSQDHHGNVCYETSCYRIVFQLWFRNATAAAVAKVESSGFVVASDGTIVKVGSLTPGSHVSRSSKSSTHLHPRRRSPLESSGAFDMSPDRRCDIGWGRSRRYVSGMTNWHRSKFHGPMEANRIDTAVQHPLSRREQSFSPHRRSVHLSWECTRSSSRSRTRSPCTWSSTIRRSGVWINGSPNVRQQSRSPNFKSERRLFKQSSLQLRTVSGELAGYTHLSKNHSSPKLASRWINDKNLHDQLREHKDKRPSGRCMPSRIFSQSSRLIDSGDRMKLDDFYQRTHSGSFHVNAVYGRGFRRDASDDVEEKSDLAFDSVIDAKHGNSPWLWVEVCLSTSLFRKTLKHQFWLLHGCDVNGAFRLAHDFVFSTRFLSYWSALG